MQVYDSCDNVTTSNSKPTPNCSFSRGSFSLAAAAHAATVQRGGRRRTPTTQELMQQLHHSQFLTAAHRPQAHEAQDAALGQDFRIKCVLMVHRLNSVLRKGF